MEFSDLKLLDENVDLSKIKPFDWDMVIHGVPYYVCRIEGYCHSLHYHNGCEARDELWCYPRNEKPSLDNLIEYDAKEPVRWGVQYIEKHYIRSKWGETEVDTSGHTLITRNDKPFYEVGGDMDYSLPKAVALISEINEHPLGFNSIDFDKKMVGRKVWYNGQPGIIDRYVEGQCCVIVVPDGFEKWENPPEFKDEPLFDEYETDIKVDCLLSERVYWFRN